MKWLHERDPDDSPSTAVLATCIRNRYLRFHSSVYGRIFLTSSLTEPVWMAFLSAQPGSSVDTARRRGRRLITVRVSSAAFFGREGSVSCRRWGMMMKKYVSCFFFSLNHLQAVAASLCLRGRLYLLGYPPGLACSWTWITRTSANPRQLRT